MATSEVDIVRVQDARSHPLHGALFTWPHERYLTLALIAALLGTALYFRTAHLSAMPGVNGDEAWWGVHAMNWWNGLPYAKRTTSGNPVDMFYLVPLALVHTLASPSFAALRTVAVFANLLALVLGFFLARRLYGDTTAWIQTVALAIAPTAIAHSRFSQEPSQSILWTSIAIYLALLGAKGGKRAWMFGVAAYLIFPIVLWTHPTNVFVAPFLLLPLMAAMRWFMPVTIRGRVIVGAVAVAVVAVTVTFGWPELQRLTASNPALKKPWFELAAMRLTSAAQWLEYARLFGRLFSGATIYQYFSSPDLDTLPYDVVISVVAVATVVGLYFALRRPQPALDCGLLLAWLTSVLLHYAFGGPDAIRPHLERWGLCLIVPTLLVVARALAAWIERFPQMRWVPVGAAAALAALQLASFRTNYFGEFQTTGGRSHRTFVTAKIEPKQAALESILAWREGDEPVIIIAREWWQFWPISYLAKNQPNVFVSKDLDSEAYPWFKRAIDHGQLYFVDFAAEPDARSALEWVRARGLRSTANTVRDRSGRDLFQILQVTRAH